MQFITTGTQELQIHEIVKYVSFLCCAHKFGNCGPTYRA